MDVIRVVMNNTGAFLLQYNVSLVNAVIKDIAEDTTSSRLLLTQSQVTASHFVQITKFPMKNKQPLPLFETTIK